MKQEVKKIWTDGLRSGDYFQGVGRLVELDENYRVVGHCCLGVLCEEAVKAGAEHQGEKIERRIIDDAVCFGTATEFADMEHGTAFLPQSVKAWAGLDSENPVLITESCDCEGIGTHDNNWNASHINDQRMRDFNGIAELIEEVL